MRARTWRRAVAVSTALWLASVSGRGAAAEDVRVGQPARVHTSSTAGGAPLTGVVTAVERDRLRLEPHGGGPSVEVPVKAIRRVETFRGTKGHALEGGLVGALVGGALALAAEKDSTRRCDYTVECSHGGAVIAVFVVPLTAGLGAAIGNGVRAEVWTPAALPRAADIPRGSDAGAMGVRLSLRF